MSLSLPAVVADAEPFLLRMIYGYFADDARAALY